MFKTEYVQGGNEKVYQKTAVYDPRNIPPLWILIMTIYSISYLNSREKKRHDILND